jgi:hypothetical protein
LQGFGQKKNGKEERKLKNSFPLWLFVVIKIEYCGGSRRRLMR